MYSKDIYHSTGFVLAGHYEDLPEGVHKVAINIFKEGSDQVPFLRESGASLFHP